MHRRRAVEPGGVIGRRQGIHQRLVPLQIDLEVVIGQERRPETSHRQQQRGWQVFGGKRPSVRPRHAPAGPLRARVLDREIGFLPGDIGGRLHLLQPRLAALPAEIGEIFPGRADDVGRAPDQIAPSVAVVIDRVAIIFRRHHLRLAELAGPGADHLLGAQVAALDHAQGIEQMAPEHVRAAAVEGERGERLERLVLALPAAEIALQPPEPGDDRGRHAELLLLAREHRLVFLDLGGTLLQPVGRQHLVGEFQEVLREEALSAVDIDDALVENEVGRSRIDGGGQDALRGGLFLEICQPAIETAGIAAIGVLAGSRGRHARQCRDQDPGIAAISHRDCPPLCKHCCRGEASPQAD